VSSLVAGVDGGQSSTRAAISDDTGRILGRGTGPPADLVGEPRISDRQRAAIALAIGAAKNAAALTDDTRLAAAVVGLTGHHGDPLSAPELVPAADAVAIVHDAVIAHAGAFGGEPGIIVLAGTGSVALGNAARGEAYVRAGGWGYFFGDRGSALGIAREAITWAMSDADRGRTSQLGNAALRFFGVGNLHEIQDAFAHGDITRAALAAFAEHVLAMMPPESSSIPAQARQLCTVAARDLADLIDAVDGRLRATPRRQVSYAGGVFRHAGLLREVRLLVENEAHIPAGQRAFSDAAVSKSAVMVEPAGDPVDGALLLARRLAHGEAVAGWARIG